MDVTSILASIDSEIARLQSARVAVSAISSTSNPKKRGPGRPKKTLQEVNKKRVLSDEARARIAAAQKKRWAASRKAK